MTDTQTAVDRAADGGRGSASDGPQGAAAAAPTTQDLLRARTAGTVLTVRAHAFSKAAAAKIAAAGGRAEVLSA